MVEETEGGGQPMAITRFVPGDWFRMSPRQKVRGATAVAVISLLIAAWLGFETGQRWPGSIVIPFAVLAAGSATSMVLRHLSNRAEACKSTDALIRPSNGDLEERVRQLTAELSEAIAEHRNAEQKFRLAVESVRARIFDPAPTSSWP